MANNPSPITLGSTVRDTVTGLRGVVVSRTEYLHGTDSLGIQAPAKDGKNPEPQYLDAARAEWCEPGSIG